MKRFLVIALLLAGCGLVPKEQSWEFVISVGGITVDPPQVTPSGLTLPVRADVSGLQTISNKPTTLNSIMACSLTQAKVEGREILVTISTSLLREGGSSQCPPAKLGKLAAGRYSVLYGSTRADAKPIGMVDVAL
jgi:hypothetical protein